MTVSRFQALTDAQWARLAPLMPQPSQRGGRPFTDHRQVVEGIIHRYRTGMPRRDLPRNVFGPWQTVWARHRRWAAEGLWDQILAVLLAEADANGLLDWTVSVDATTTRAHQHATNTPRPEQDTAATSRQADEPPGHGIGRSRGGWTVKIHHAVEGRGRPVAVVVTGGQRNDGTVLEQVLADIRVPRTSLGRPRTAPETVVADKAYATGPNRRYLRSRGIKVVIPTKRDQDTARKKKGSEGGRPPSLLRRC